MLDKRWTWNELVVVVPALVQLERDIKAVRRPLTGPFCANRLWYAKFKRRLLPLVGWESSNPVVGSEQAYDLAYRHLYNLLPDCRDCTCM